MDGQTEGVRPTCALRDSGRALHACTDGWMMVGWTNGPTDRGVRPDLTHGFLAMLFIPSFSAHSGCQAFLVSMTWAVATAWSSTGAVNSCFSLSMALKSHTLFKGPCGQKGEGLWALGVVSVPELGTVWDITSAAARVWAKELLASVCIRLLDAEQS